jgi:poly-gamma-glutamate synthesis protein (capsule biosynthesis protein)
MKQFATIVFVGLLGSALGFGAAFTYSHSVYTNPVPPSTAAVTSVIEEFPDLLFVGDVMLGRNVENLMNKYGDEYPFIKVSDLLRSADAVIANLEGPVMENHKHTPSGSLRFAFDERMPSMLASHTIGIVTLANNHTFDFGSAGYIETKSLLTKAGVESFGHPFSTGEQYILRKKVKGVTFIFVGFNFTNPKFNTQDAYKLLATIKPQPNEFLIAVIHGGDEYKLISNKHQQEFYRGLIDRGAQAVIAHHPHVVEEVELYKDKPIFYSLGNFIFDQYFSKDVQEELAVRMHFDRDTITYTLIPISSTYSQPSIMTQEKSENFLQRLAERSTLADKSNIQAGSFTLNR